MSSIPSSITQATALRWRARFTQQDTTLDSALSRDEEEYDWKDWSDTKNDPSTTKNSLKKRRRYYWPAAASTFCRLELGLLAAAALTLSAVTLTRTWWMAVTATLQLAQVVLVYVQSRVLRRAGNSSFHNEHQWLTQKVAQLWRENERIGRRLEQQGSALDRVHEIQGRLAHVTVSGDDGLDRLVETVRQQKEVQAELHAALRRQVQQHIIGAVLEADTDRNFAISGPELERLLVRLQNLDGVHVNERELRALLVTGSTTTTAEDADENHESASSFSSALVLRKLLRHVQEDGLSLSTTRSTSSARTIFSFDPAQLLTKRQPNTTQRQSAAERAKQRVDPRRFSPATSA